MSFADAIRQTAQPWRLVVCSAVVGFLALSAATNSFRIYHLFLLAAIPAALFAAEAGRRFFFDWGPLMMTWLAYDRFRLVQPLLLARVGVAWPYRLEEALFGWMAGGRVPAHAARAWFAAHAASPLWTGVLYGLEIVYISHIFTYPLLFLAWWLRGRRHAADRERFVRHAIAFAIVNAIGFVGYALAPAAPPWWVSLNGMAQPTPDLVAAANLAAGIDGLLIQKTIETAPNWFAAVPSLHGAYPVLLFMLAWRGRSKAWLATIAVYGAAMWISTVALNLHYVVDLLLGAAVAAAAWWLTERLAGWGILERLGGIPCESRTASPPAA